ncbi:hypothetical protein AcW1_008388 [Taiwanofungus camphoratus]|nr:hypothetical protein AcW1_008388 [Antrodia cinnamomea]
MRERLTKLVGKETTGQIKIGTFHALCAMFLRWHAGLVGIEGSFTICDADESKKIIKRILEPFKDALAERNITLKEATVLSNISQAKAKGRSADDLLERFTSTKREYMSKNKLNLAEKSMDEIASTDIIEYTVAQVYREYEKVLRISNSLDFDDLLVFGVKLFANNPKVGEWCRHVLVDEFQDTNNVQYDLMRHIAAASSHITIVGDPDQSIYGWRSAEVENLSKMQRDFPSTHQIFLEQNYRSTGAILAASIAVIAQDRKRIPKSLHTTHPSGPVPVLRSFPFEQSEAAFIAVEIKRLVACTGGMLRWGDFVVLLRFNALSRQIESALQKEGIPNRVLGGHKFFERLEVKDLLAYLQVIDNPHFSPAFTRVINVPSRGIGEKTISEILSTAERVKLSPLEVAEQIFDGKMPDIKPSVKRKLTTFLRPIRELRKLANEGTSPSDLIRRLLDLIKYESHLKKTQQDWESRWDNVQELINFASEVESSISRQESGTDTVDIEDESASGWDDVFEDFDEDQSGGVGSAEFRHHTDGKGKGKTQELMSQSQRDTPLRLFLQASMLSTDTKAQSDEAGERGKVTISTCHAAKGLEWPVVMVPAVEKGTFPSHRTEDVEEERRLLYVACTRAQSLLYLSWSTARMVAGEVKQKELSDFVSVITKDNPTIFTDQLPNLQMTDRALIARVLDRTPPDESDVARMIAEHNQIAKPSPWNRNEGDQVSGSYESSGRSSVCKPPLLTPVQGTVTFQSAKLYLPAALSERPFEHCRPSSRPLSPSCSFVLNSALGSTPQTRPPSIASNGCSSEAPHPPTKQTQPQPFSRPLEANRTTIKSASTSNTRTQDAVPPASSSFLGSEGTSSSGQNPSGPSMNKSAGAKRRLGVGPGGAGYPKKKFRIPFKRT